jgi:hypothetical protein
MIRKPNATLDIFEACKTRPMELVHARNGSSTDYRFARDHRDAMMQLPTRHPAAAFENAIVRMLRALAIYADAHFERFDSPLGEDYVLGDAWADALDGVRRLLEGERGRLDAGAVDNMIRNMAELNGFDRKEITRPHGAPHHA